ncbi:MAG: ribosome maturation factor RimP, partial [Clostridia bacterium]|nr:ribosome maturation factor RimP [Clostridia bacterium]
MKTTERVEQLTRDTVEAMGFELCDVEYQKEYGNWVLTLYIDREGGVTIDDCEAVSRAVEPVLDEADPIDAQYYLSVSS